MPSDESSETFPARGNLPPDHRCRVDDIRYDSVGAWFEDHHGRVPIQAAAGLDRYIRDHGCTFAEAFAVMTNGGPIILIEPASTSESAPAVRRRQGGASHE